MSIKTDYPRMFDDTTIPFGEWTVKYDPVENEEQSEGGTDLVEQVRAEKATISASLSVAGDEWVAFFHKYALKGSFTLKQYSPKDAGYESRTVRLRSLTIKPKKGSEALTGVTGVWDISFTLKEF